MCQTPNEETLIPGAVAGAVAAALATILVGCAHAPSFHGPLPVRNQHPAQLTVMQMRPAAAEAVDAGTVRLATDVGYSSLFLTGAGNGNQFVMDGEFMRWNLRAGIGLGRGLQLDLEVPFGHGSGGFLDDFVIDWHDFFSLPDQNRDSAPRGEFLVRASHQGSTAYELAAHGLQLMDVPLVLTWAPDALRNESLAFALRGGIELPTGNEDRGFGNGELDESLGVLATWRTRCWALHGHLEHTLAGTPDGARAAGTEFRDVTSWGVGLEVPLADDVWLLAQVDGATSTLRALGFDRVADQQWLLWTGLRARIHGNLYMELALGEDLSPFVAPDFTAWFGFAWRP